SESRSPREASPMPSAKRRFPMAETRTLMIGDEIALGLENPFRTNGALPLWVSAFPGSDLHAWASKSWIDDAVNGIKLEKHDPPNLVLVSLGRVDAITEPDDVDPNVLAAEQTDVNAILDKIAAAAPGARIIWILAPAIQGE